MDSGEARKIAEELTGLKLGAVLKGPKGQFAVTYDPAEPIPVDLGPVLVWPGGAKILPSMYTGWPKWLQDY